VSHRHIQTDYLDPAGLQQMAAACQAATTEFENVPADALAQGDWARIEQLAREACQLKLR
jgi:phosphoribosylaminoimidazole carboxylase (NCAIR synthetase)